VDAVGDFSLRTPVEADERRGGVLSVLASRSMRGWLQASTTRSGHSLPGGAPLSPPFFFPPSSSSLAVDRGEIPKAAADREMRMGFDL
jgi:hypothetical protein